MTILVRLFLLVEALTLSTLLILYLTTELYFVKFLETIIGLGVSTENVYGTHAEMLNAKTSTFHDVQSVTGDAVCLALVLRALLLSNKKSKNNNSASRSSSNAATTSALIAIAIDHGGFAVACYLQWGLIQPVLQGGALSATALCLWLSGAAAEEEKPDDTAVGVGELQKKGN